MQPGATDAFDKGHDAPFLQYLGLGLSLIRLYAGGEPLSMPKAGLAGAETATIRSDIHHHVTGGVFRLLYASICLVTTRLHFCIVISAGTLCFIVRCTHVWLRSLPGLEVGLLLLPGVSSGYRAQLVHPMSFCLLKRALQLASKISAENKRK